MKIITTICVSTEVYQFLRNEATTQGFRTPERYIEVYLSRHAGRMMRKRNNQSVTSETPSHPDPDTDTPAPSPTLFF